MYKHSALLVRKDGMTHEEFLEYWQHEHVPIAKDIPGVVRYATVVPDDPAASEFDGLAELTFEDLETLRTALGHESSRDYDPDGEESKTSRADVDRFIDVDRRPRFVGEEIVQKDETGGDTDGLVKHAAFLVRKEGMTHEEFLEYWQHEHVPVAKEIPGVVRYVTLLPVDPEASEFDGVAELYFESVDALRASLGNESSRDYDPDDPESKTSREDVDNFLAVEKRPRFVGTEIVQKSE